jgi:hypothetical protein
MFTSSMAVPRHSALDARGREFFRTLAAQVFADHGTKTLLLKHTHVDDEVLRAMHAPMLERIGALKPRVDPRGVLGSRFFERLQGAPASSAVGHTGATEAKALPRSANVAKR